MQEDVANFLSFQLRRCTESGDTELVMAQLQKYLELEREAKMASGKTTAEPANVRRFPGLRAVN